MKKVGFLVVWSLISVKPTSFRQFEKLCRHLWSLQGAAEQSFAKVVGTAYQGGLDLDSVSGRVRSKDAIGIQSSDEGRLREAVEALDFMVQGGSYVPVSQFHQVLKTCVAQKDLVLGRHVHTLTLKTGYQSNQLLANQIMRMYVCHGRLQEAIRVFTEVTEPDTFMWHSLISAYADSGHPSQAIELYQQMRQSTVKPNSYVHVAVLKACASALDLNAGKQVHADVVGSKVEPNIFVGSSLVDMYSKCGRLEDAREVFDNMPVRDAVSWNAMIAGYAQHGQGQQALSLYEKMQQQGSTPANYVTFVCLLKACASIKDLRKGKEIHCQVHRRGLEGDVVIGSCLVDMYAKCGNLQDARKVFDMLPTRNVVAWTAMIAGYVQHGLGHEALTLYSKMQEEGAAANHVTFACVLKACGSVGALDEGKQLHSQIQERRLETDLVVGNCLVDMYVKCGSLEDARRVFDNLPTKDVVTWTAMIAGYAQQGLGSEALCLHASMKQEGVSLANHVTFACLLKACISIGSLHHGKQLHSEIQQRGLETDLVVGNCLVDMYAKCGSLEDARRVFDRMPKRDVVTWNAMIGGYAQKELGQEALALYSLLEREGICIADNITFACGLKACGNTGDLHRGQQLHTHIQERALGADLVVGNCLIDMYARCGSLQDAHIVFDKMPTKDVVTWNSMITGYAQKGLGEEALRLYRRMQQEGLTVGDNVTLKCLLKACASVGALQLGRQLHLQIQERGEVLDVVVGSCLVDMYAKCGRLDEARRVFDNLPTKDVVTWTAMINGYGQSNESQMAIQCFEEMQLSGVKPDQATFICLLVACSHHGMVRKGQQYFKMMAEDHGIVPTVDHYNCMVDLLGRAGHLDEAESVLLTMPLESNVVGWMSLLNACKNHGDIQRATECFNRLVKLEPQHSAAYLHLANIYADAGLWGDVERIESLRRSAGACKKPATASIEVNSKVETFAVGEERADISSKLRSANLQLEEGGHIPHTDLVLKSVPDGEKEDVLCGHAEKLALAYGLLNTPDGAILLVTKNLRMCSDCHSGTKVMSRVEKREIIVRDAHRVHHFVDGSCSCGDRH